MSTATAAVKSQPDHVELLHDIRSQLNNRGYHSFRVLTSAFAVNDLRGDRTIDITTFNAILSRCGIFIKQQDSNRLFRSLQPNEQHQISYPTFLTTLQGTLSDKRYQCIVLVFDNLDSQKRGKIPKQIIFDRFNSSQHPEVLSGKKRNDEVKNELKIALDGSSDELSRDEFIDYFSGISTCIPFPDDYFCSLLFSCWNVSAIELSGIRTSLLAAVRSILRNKLSLKRVGFRTACEKLRTIFKWWDLHNTGYVNYEQFHGSIQRFGLILADETTQELFTLFDHQQTGQINYTEFLTVLFEEDIVNLHLTPPTSTTTTQRYNIDDNNNSNGKEKQIEEKRDYRTSQDFILSSPKNTRDIEEEEKNIIIEISNNNHNNTNTNAATISSSKPVQLTLPNSNGIVFADSRVSIPTILFVLGGPGSGKGTQCARIVNDYGFIHLSTGDLLRAEQSNSNSPYASIIKECIAAGKLVPVTLIVQLLSAAIKSAVLAGNSYFLLDGFPRAMDQLDAWNELFGSSVRVPFILYFDCPFDVLESRLLNRGLSSGRADDNIGAIKKRFLTFDNESRPVVQQFAKEGRVRVIDGTQTPDMVYQQVQRCIQSINIDKKNNTK